MLRHLLLLGSIAAIAMGQTYKPSEENLKMRRWFQDAKFGMFVHWGVFSNTR